MMSRQGQLAVALAALAVASSALAAEPIAARGAVAILDGDTVDIDGVRIRLLDIDTPETDRPRCENELTLGLEAKLRLRQLLDAGQVAYVVDGRYRTDRFNRTLAHVTVAGRDVGAVLLAEGLALVWSPGPKAKAARLAIWCRK